MFRDLSMSDYNIEFELQQSYFLRDCLRDEISYEVKDGEIIIYKTTKGGVSEQISLDLFIFYIQYDVAKIIKDAISNYSSKGVHDIHNPPYMFRRYFGKIENIRKAVQNMKLILLYDEDETDESDDEYEPDNPIRSLHELIKEVSTMESN